MLRIPISSGFFTATMPDLLIDTHVFLWWEGEEPRLGPAARNAIADSGNQVFVSAVSILEIALKVWKRKLEFDGSPTAAAAANGFHELPILSSDAEAGGMLDWEHADPFDRLLVAQAARSSLVLVTADRAIARYNGVAQLWAGR